MHTHTTPHTHTQRGGGKEGESFLKLNRADEMAQQVKVGKKHSINCNHSVVGNGLDGDGIMVIRFIVCYISYMYHNHVVFKAPP